MKRIREITKKPKSTVQYTVKRYSELQIFEDRDRSGRSPKIACIKKQKTTKIMRKIQSNRMISASQGAIDLMVDYNIKATS